MTFALRLHSVAAGKSRHNLGSLSYKFYFFSPTMHEAWRWQLLAPLSGFVRSELVSLQLSGLVPQSSSFSIKVCAGGRKRRERGGWHQPYWSL